MLCRHIFATAFLVLCLSPGARPASFDIHAVPLSEPVREFYLKRDWAPAWSGSAPAEADARQAVAALSKAASEGLDPERYRIANMGDPFPNDAAITGAVLTYMRDLALGRPELRSLDSDIGLPPRSMDFPALLDEALRQHRLAQMLADLSPKHPEYMALKVALPGAGEKSAIVSANMERWRWLPTVLEADRIVVNAASAELELSLGGKRVLTSRVVVGRPSDPTPILRAEGAGITVNPSWTIPRSIAANEILPKLKKDPAWLVKHDMILLDGPAGDPQGLRVDWRAVRSGSFPYQIRQYPGPRNPLGQIKLELPNRLNVYLHDTPNKADFQKTARQLSHGCVRVEKILPLATYALGADITAIQKISEAIEQGGTKYLPLRKKLPVYLLYWTAASGDDGNLIYFPDVYGRDGRLIAAMRPNQIRIASVEPPCMRG